jgi:outer membrane protein assembly factor BamB
MDLRSLWTWYFPAACWLLITLSSARLAAQDKQSDWPQFRGPTGQGASRDRGLPLSWSQKENVAWKTELPGPSASSPIVIGSRVFVTCSSGYGVPWQGAGDIDQLKLHLICLDRDRGNIVWDTKVAAKLPEEKRIRESHGYASGTPAADGERIYVSFGKTGVFAFDYDGKEVWQADIGSETNGWGTTWSSSTPASRAAP